MVFEHTLIWSGKELTSADELVLVLRNLFNLLLTNQKYSNSLAMAIFRCNKCTHIREVERDYIGKSVKCPKCKNPSKVHDTIAFTNALITRNTSQTLELNELRGGSVKEMLDSKDENLEFEDIDVQNTSIFTQENSFSPIAEWFDNKNITANIDPSAVDTTGFFDEIALLLGKNFEVLSPVSNQIKYIQNKGYSNVKIEVSKKSEKETKQIKAFCKELYNYSFVSKYHYQKKEKIIRLSLQSAPKIKRFFNGIWMEWFALIELLKFFNDNQIIPACGRSIEVSFANGGCNELDLFFLMNGEVPICIECKSGEFRHDIEKYLSLRKRLKMKKEQFIVCVFGLSSEQAKGMTSMYELTFVNENTLIEHVSTII